MVLLQNYYPIWEKIDVCCDTVSCYHYPTCCQIPTEIFRYSTADNVNLLFVGQGGGEDEERLHIPFIGDSGQRLRSIIEWILKDGIKFSVAFSNSVRCRPVQPNLSKKKNRNPFQQEIEICCKYLIRDILLLEPSIVVPLGNSSTQALIPNAVGKIGIDRKNVFTVNVNGRSQIMIPTYHPSYLIRNGRNFSTYNSNKYDEKVKKDICNMLNLIEL